MVSETKCIYGNLGGTRLDGLNVAYYFGKRMDCVDIVLSYRASASASVFVNPYQNDPPHDCYAFDSHENIKLVHDPGYMTCFYKGL